MPRRSNRSIVAALLALALTVGACTSTTAGPQTTSSSALSTTPGRPTSPSETATSSSSSTSAEGRTTGPSGTVGAEGIGDPHYPLAGNGGYEVDSYDIDLSYDPESNGLQSTAHLAGTVTSAEGLTQFNLDLQPTMEVSAVTVNGESVNFSHDGSELVITPAALLEPEAALAIDVSYSGKPAVVRGGRGGAPDGGWYRTDSGGAFAAGEPVSASAWYPVNEHPADTATFAVTATVPNGWQVISNGLRQYDDLPDPGQGNSVFRWKLDQPVASYLTTVYIDKFTTIEDTLPDGKPVVLAIGPNVQDGKDLAAQTKKVIEVLSGYFGPYPFSAAGGILTGESSTDIDLETATRPIYSGASLNGVDIVVHELSHQWYGNTVAIKQWSDICINECVASYAPWLWKEQVDGTDLDAMWKRQMRRAVDDEGFWRSPLVDMPAGQEFTSVYSRGPLAMHALRKEMGDNAFLILLKQWPATYAGKHASFDDFEAFVSTVAGRDLAPFVDAWFRGETVPSSDLLYPGDLGK